MSNVDYPDRHHLSAAIGWLELGAPDEAELEFGRIKPESASRDESLDVRWQIDAARGDWKAALETARRHLQANASSPTPWIHQSFALHELKLTGEAYRLLHPVAERFIDVGVIPYNLACYSCGLGQLEESRGWLRKAVSIMGRNETIAMASTDPDLVELRTWLSGL